MRSRFLLIVLLALAVVASARPASALPILSIPYLKAGPAFYLNPFEEANLEIIELNTSSLAAEDSEAFALAFVPTGNAEPGAIGATPALAQTAERTVVGTRTYFYQDFLFPTV